VITQCGVLFFRIRKKSFALYRYGTNCSNAKQFHGAILPLQTGPIFICMGLLQAKELKMGNRRSKPPHGFFIFGKIYTVQCGFGAKYFYRNIRITNFSDMHLEEKVIPSLYWTDREFYGIILEIRISTSTHF
jgi:hypothetical protein